MRQKALKKVLASLLCAAAGWPERQLFPPLNQPPASQETLGANLRVGRLGKAQTVCR